MRNATATTLRGLRNAAAAALLAVVCLAAVMPHAAHADVSLSYWLKYALDASDGAPRRVLAVDADGNVSLDDGAGDTPWFRLVDGDDQYLSFNKLDAGAAAIVNSEGALNLQLSGDTDDYFTFNTVTNVPTIGTAGGCNLKVTADGGTIDFDDENLTTTGTITFAGATITGNVDATGAIFMGASPLVLEGATDNAYQLTFAVTDPTGARVATWQDASGTVVLHSAAVTDVAGTHLTVTTGTLDVDDDFLLNNGDTGTGDYDLTGAILLGATPLVFEGATDNDYQVLLSITDPTADRTITVPDAGGLLLLDGSGGAENAGNVVILGTLDLGKDDDTSTLTIHHAGTIVLYDASDDTSVTIGPVGDGTTVLGLTGSLNATATLQSVTLTDGSISITGGNLTGATGVTATTLYGTLDTNVAAAAVTLAGATLAADGTDAAIPITLDAKGSAGTGYIEVIDDDNAGWLAVGRTSASKGSRLSITDGGADNMPGSICLYEDDGNGSYLWFNTAGVLRAAGSAFSDDDADGYALIDATTGTIGASTQAVNGATFTGTTFTDGTASLTAGALTGLTGALTIPHADGLTLGKDDATNTAGTLKLWSSGATDFYTTITAPTQTGNVTITTPTALPAGTYLLNMTTGGQIGYTDPAGFQAADAELAGLAGLSGTGLIAQTGAGTFAERTITGTANEISVADGNGVSANPTLSLPATIDMGGKTSLEIPNAADPTCDALGEFAQDTTDNALIGYDGTAERVYAMPVKTFTVTLLDDGNWLSEVKPFFQVPAEAAITIKQVQATVLGSSTPSLTYNIEERASGSLNAAGTDVYASDQVADGDGEGEDSFSNAGIAASAFLVFTTEGSGVESGTVDAIVIRVSYYVDVE